MTEKQKFMKRDLKKIVKKGDTLYTILRHTSSSGMSRDISVIIIKKGVPLYLDYQVSEIIEWNMSKEQGIKVSGAGMDMGFHLIYTLSSVLFGNSKNRGDAGYFLKQRWL